LGRNLIVGGGLRGRNKCRWSRKEKSQRKRKIANIRKQQITKSLTKINREKIETRYVGIQEEWTVRTVSGKERKGKSGEA